MSVSKNTELLAEWRKTLQDEIVRSPFIPVEIPTGTLIARTLSALRQHSEAHPGKPAILRKSFIFPSKSPLLQIDAFNPNRRLAYRQIHDQALSIAAFLKSLGFGESDRATTVLTNCVEFPVIHLGVWAAGGTFVGTSPAFKHHETIYQLRDSTASVVFTSESLLKSVLSAVKDCPEVKKVVCLRSSASPLPEHVIDFQKVLEFAPLLERDSVSMDSPCIVYYSSGTTGQPKGVIHTHRTYHTNVEIIKNHFLNEVYPALGVSKVDWYQDCQIISSGCFHIMAFGLLNWWLLTGSPVIIMERLDAVLFAQLVDQYKPRYLFMSPPIFAYLAKDPIGRAAKLESVQLVLCGAAPLGQKMSDEFFSHHPNTRYIVQAYGMTETGCSHFPILTNEGATASSGVVASNYEQRIVDPNSQRPCSIGELGEIYVKGPGNTVGYLNKPEATKNLFDEDGWLRTGDIGYLDEFGGIYVVDRVKELIKVNYANQSLQVPPAELEGILLSHSSIRDVAIVGVPHEAGGELVRAFVVKADEKLVAADVKQIVADKLAPFKQITGGVVFMDAIPRSATGKILRRELREQSVVA